MIDPATLRKLIDYDPDTGTLTWKRRTADVHPNDAARKTFNSRFSGKLALAANNGSGYRAGTVFGTTQKAHRVAWAIHYGEWPNEIDHINGVTSDNRISNLRDVTHQENIRNAAVYGTNTSGHHGVRWRADAGKWVANIRTNSKQVHLGYFSDKAEAIAARKAAETEHGYHKNHGRNAT
tara:strand:- start:57 stop:593 length:537 start_codon:yes stop_codon:yes gene_type:complete